MFKNTCDNKRYYTFNYYLRNKFNNKVKDNEEHEIYFFDKKTIYKVKRND